MAGIFIALILYMKYISELFGIDFVLARATMSSSRFYWFLYIVYQRFLGAHKNDKSPKKKSYQRVTWDLLYIYIRLGVIQAHTMSMLTARERLRKRIPGHVRWIFFVHCNLNHFTHAMCCLILFFAVWPARLFVFLCLLCCFRYGLSIHYFLLFCYRNVCRPFTPPYPNRCKLSSETKV